jgi:hypothetical protein
MVSLQSGRIISLDSIKAESIFKYRPAQIDNRAAERVPT